MKAQPLSQKEFTERWSELHGGAEIEGAVSRWLRISYPAARVCSALRISPNVLTLLGLGTAIAMGLSTYAAISLSTYAAISLLLLTISLFFDGIDGSVAILQGRESKWGSLLDSVAEEYARARLASLGHSEIGVLTPTERPVRAIFMAFVLVFYIFDIPGTLLLSYGFLALLLFSFLKVMKSAERILS